jgi:tetratricopeptide (TPR) repeat protein
LATSRVIEDAAEDTSMNRNRLGLAIACAAALVLVSSAIPVSAQTGMAKGKVVDTADKPVEGAKVTIVAKGMKNTRELKTNKKGEWVQIGLFPGDYEITAEKGDDKGNVSTRISIGENPEIMIRVGRAGPSPEMAAKAAALQKSFDEGVALSKAGDFDGSITKFNEAIAQAPQCQDCYYNIGFAHGQKKEWDKAEVAYKKAIELKPDYAEAWSGLANAYNQQKKLDLALEATANAAKYGGAGATGGGASALYNQGVILWNQNKYAEAKEKFAEAAKADPSYADAHYRLGMANLNLGDMPGAVTAFEAYLKAAPTGQYADQVKGVLSSIKK